MSSELEMFEPVALAYSAPRIDRDCSHPPPQVFYNAFPDLNDRAADGSRSVFASRAKYLLPLHCVFNPYGVNVTGGGRVNRNSISELEFTLAENFEAVHRILGCTDAKCYFRFDKLSKFYTALQNTISSGKIIKVPLVATEKGSKIQRQWCRITRWFRISCLIDEAFSLLVTLASIPEKEVRDKYEAIWVPEEDEDLKKNMKLSFAPFYRDLREHVESQYGKLDSLEFQWPTWLERVMELGRSTFSRAGIQTVNAKDLRAFGGYLLLTIMNSKIRCLSEFESLHSMLTVQMLEDNPIVEDSTQYFRCNVDTIKQEPYSYKVEVNCTQLLADLICSYGECEQHIAVIFAGRTIFIEAIRQQICQGVGLCCPFWNGKCCDSLGIFRPLLEQTYQITRPWKWPQHWQKPPCLE
jgi:hypothetical protein